MHPFDQLEFVAKVGLAVLGVLYFGKFFLVLLAMMHALLQELPQ